MARLALQDMDLCLTVDEHARRMDDGIASFVTTR